MVLPFLFAAILAAPLKTAVSHQLSAVSFTADNQLLTAES